METEDANTEDNVKKKKKKKIMVQLNLRYCVFFIPWGWG
jgi:hypothetical protein